MLLTPPSDELQALSARLRDLIHREIKDCGPMTFARYMELALYAPGLGYYSAGLNKFGRRGDFVTAPELGPVFAQSMAISLADFLRADATRCVLEIGAGSGAFARDFLQQLQSLDALPAHYYILERSGDLRARQRERIAQTAPEWLPRLTWLDAPPAHAWNGVLLANEVIDALPCERFVAEGKQVSQMMVSEKAGQLVAVQQPATGELLRQIEALQLPVDQSIAGELWPQLPAWLTGLTEKLQQGLAVFIDYGEGRQARYAGARANGTLRCFYQQQLHEDPFWYPGLCDITADVDFTSLAHAAQACHLQVQGFCSQSIFLLHGGLPQVFANMPMLDVREQLNLSAQIKTLTLPSAMGERFKVMSFSCGLDADNIPAIFSKMELAQHL
jgi:SAM-dependent MidA family methyltransferase